MSTLPAHVIAGRVPVDALGLPVTRGRSLHERLQRAGIWTIIWAGLGIAAAYLLYRQRGELRAAVASLRDVHAGWLVLGITLVALRFLLCALAVRMVISRPLPFGPTLLVQLAIAAVGRFTPSESIGGLVLNQRYLERSSIGRTTALAGLALKALTGGVTRIVVMVLVAALVGTSGMMRLDLPVAWPVLLAGAAALALGGVIHARRRRAAVDRLAVAIRQAGRDVTRLARQPMRATALFAVSLAITFSYGLILVICVTAFGADVSPLQIYAVYLGGSTVASASPTPGNLGAVEMALAAGLTAIGVLSAPAVAAVLIFRLITFWLPVLPGIVAFRYLQKRSLV